MEKKDGRVYADFGRWENVIQGLIVLSLIEIAIETLPNLGEPWVNFLNVTEIVTVSIFSVEYIARILLSRPRLSYAFSFLGIVDLIAILPFFLATGIDIRSVRAFRLLRLFRLLKLARYSAAIQRYHRAFLMIREELVLFGATALILLYVSSVGIYYFEHDAQPEVFASVFHSMWWSIATLTTVGYGDVYPITVGGKIFTSIIVLTGLGIIAVPTGLFASALTKARELD